MIVCTQCGRRNPDGSHFCTNPDCGAYLEWNGRETGVVTPVEPLPRQRPAAPPPAPPGGQPEQPRHRHPDERRDEPAAQRQSVQATLPEAAVSVAVGEEAAVTVRVRNNGTVVEELTLAVLGAAADWAVIEPERLQLFPGAEGVATVTFGPPRAPDTPVGPVPYRVQATSRVNTSVAATVSGVVAVGGYGATTLELVPQTASGRFRTRHNLAVTNGGNMPLVGDLSARDPDETLSFRVEPAMVQVPPGGRAAARVRARPRTLLWWGTGRRRPFEVRLDPREAEPVTGPVSADATMMQNPIIPSWSFKLAAVAGALALAVAAFALLRGGDEPTAPAAAPTQVGQAADASAAPPASPRASGPPAAPMESPPAEGTTGEPAPSPPQNPPQNPPADGQAPALRSAAQVEIPENSFLDLDEGERNPELADRDVWFHTPPGRPSLLTSQNGARLGTVTAAQPIERATDLQTLFRRCNGFLATVTEPDDHISVEELDDATMVVCARTDEGRVSAFRVEPFDTSEWAMLELATWELP